MSAETRNAAKSIQGHLTVNDVAIELGMTSSGVYKLIQRGHLKAVRLSARRTYVPEPALAAYQARLNGEKPDVLMREPGADITAARSSFKQELGLDPGAWLASWKSGEIPDTAENNQTAIRALSIVVESESAGF